MSRRREQGGSGRRVTPKPYEIEPPMIRRHGHVFDGEGFCRICQEHREWLRAAPSEPMTPAEVLGEAGQLGGRHAPASTDAEWRAALVDSGPPAADGQP